jgi:cellulose synthase/poly-beta-1,6-N-acetylglucosamine synthase-like glycosyltransferase
MITNILLTKGYERGYLPKGESAMIQPIFATANLAIKREALDTIGLFDVNCKTGEDVDLSIRLSRTNLELFFEPRAIIRHKHRTTLPELLTQWYRYGKYHPYIFKKHSLRCIKIYYPNNRVTGWSSVQFSRIFGLPVPFHTLIFVTPFHLFNILLIPIAISIVFKLLWLAVLSLIAWSMVWLRFEGSSFIKKLYFAKLGRRAVYFFLKYFQNWAYVIGAFLGGLSIGVIYIEATRQ